MNSQNPEELEKQIAGYVLGDLTTEEVVEIDKILALNPELLIEMAQFQQVFSLLPLALPETYPSAQLRSQILENFKQQNLQLAKTERNTQTVTPETAKKFLNKTYLVGALITALLIGIGFDSYRTKQQLAIAQAELSNYQQALSLLKQPNNRLLALKGMGELPAASGSLVIDTQSKTGLLCIQRLSMPPQNMNYRLWALIDGRKAFITEFTPDQTGAVILSLPMETTLKGAKSVAITLEQKQAPLQPKGEMVMRGESSL